MIHAHQLIVFHVYHVNSGFLYVYIWYDINVLGIVATCEKMEVSTLPELIQARLLNLFRIGFVRQTSFDEHLTHIGNEPSGVTLHQH
jgi:hypothetical protein